jgi:hypothetical protein
MVAFQPLTIEESARLISGWQWAEARLYEVVGAWAPSALGAAAKIYFDACSQHHAWRARLWEERRRGLPTHLVPAYDQDEVAMARTASTGGATAGTAVPEAGVPYTGVPEAGVPETGVPDTGVPDTGVPETGVPPAVMAETVMSGLAGVPDDAGRLSAYCRVVLPRIVVEYRSWQQRCSPVADRTVARVIGFALVDVMADWERGTALLAGYLSGEGGEQAALHAADASRELDQLLARGALLPGG